MRHRARGWEYPTSQDTPPYRPLAEQWLRCPSLAPRENVARTSRTHTRFGPLPRCWLRIPATLKPSSPAGWKDVRNTRSHSASSRLSLLLTCICPTALILLLPVQASYFMIANASFHLPFGVGQVWSFAKINRLPTETREAFATKGYLMPYWQLPHVE